MGGRRAYVSRSDGTGVVVLDERCERQDPADLADLACALSEEFDCSALGVLIHDDDVLHYVLAQSGEVVDEYTSPNDMMADYLEMNPDAERPPAGDPARLASAFPPADVERLAEILSGGHYLLQSERHADLVEALSLPRLAVGAGVNYVRAGDVPPDADSSTFVSTR